MITQFYIEGFKSFSEPAHADLNDLVVIAGSNSCGKSSLLQALLLLAQTLQNPRPDVVLDLGGKYIQFAEFREAVYGRPSSTQTSFTIGFNTQIPESSPRSVLLNTDLFFRYMPSSSRTRQLKREQSDESVSCDVDIKIKFGADRSGTPIIKSASYQKTLPGFGIFKFDLERNRKKYRATSTIQPVDGTKTIEVSQLVQRINSLIDTLNSQSQPGGKRDKSYPLRSTNDIFNRFFTQYGFEYSDIPEIEKNLLEKFAQIYRSYITRDQVNDLNDILLDLLTYTYQAGVVIPLSTVQPAHLDHFLLPTQYRVSPVDNVFLRPAITTLGGAIGEVRRFLRSTKYIGPLRAKPERAYLAAGTPLDIGNAGENAIPLLYINQTSKVSNKTKIGDAISERKLVDAVQDWLQEFGIASSFHITKPKRVIYQAELESAPGSGTVVTIADVGFGVSQILPVVVAGLTAPNGSTLIFEQPEIHLHPRLQSKLADFLICLTELDKRVIVETHSEHLINKLRLRIVQDSTGLLKQKIGILFVKSHDHDQQVIGSQGKKREKGSYVENLKVDEYGKIINWPPDFFPESSELSEEILKAMINKMSEGSQV